MRPASNPASFLLLALGLACAAPPALAADPVLDPYIAAAKQENPAFAGFSAQRGEHLFRSKHAGSQEESCTSCHTADPRKAGQHAKTGKSIEPLASTFASDRHARLVTPSVCPRRSRYSRAVSAA